MGARRFRWIVAVVLLAFAVGCGESEGEAAFREASEELSERQQAVSEARRRVVERETVLEEAEAELLEARETLAEAQAELVEARSRVGRYATDDVLFRRIQGQLLEDEQLTGFAVSARVEKGVVTLSGVVEKAAQRERAGEIAEAVPGVIGVENKVSVTGPQRGA